MDVDTRAAVTLDARPAQLQLGAPDDWGAYGELEPVGTGLTDQDGRLRLSFSRVDTYRSCPARFRYAYLDRLPTPPSPHLSFGTSIHRALERFYDRKLPHCPSVDDLLGHLYEVWDTTGFARASRDEQLAWYRHAQDVLRRYHERVAGRFRLPADVEKWFEVPFGDDVLVVGSIDRIDVREDGGLEVIDYKTNKRVGDRERVRSSLQLAIYALACEHLYGQLPEAVTLDFVVAGLRVDVSIDEIDLDAARTTVADVAAAVRAERFVPRPGPVCRWCDFRSACPAWEGDGDDVLGPAVDRLDELRRRVRRDVRALRELEVGVQRLVDQLTARDVGAEGGDPGP